MYFRERDWQSTRERALQGVCVGGGAEGEERETLSWLPDERRAWCRASPRTLRSWSELKWRVGCLNYWATQVLLQWAFLNICLVVLIWEFDIFMRKNLWVIVCIHLQLNIIKAFSKRILPIYVHQCLSSPTGRYLFLHLILWGFNCCHSYIYEIVSVNLHLISSEVSCLHIFIRIYWLFGFSFGNCLVIVFLFLLLLSPLHPLFLLLLLFTGLSVVLPTFQGLFNIFWAFIIRYLYHRYLLPFVVCLNFWNAEVL